VSFLINSSWRLGPLFIFAVYILAAPLAVLADDGDGIDLADSQITNGSPPVRISIPAIGLDTDVMPVATDDDGAMSAPDNPDAVGWYSLGPGIGIGGNVVLAAHVDWGGRLRAFGRLHSVSEGDSVTIWDASGGAERYVVQSSDWVEAEGAAVEEIFGSREAPTITLITCGGTFDPWSHQYLHRLIVRALRTAEDT